MPEASSQLKPRILVIEDNPADVDLLRRALTDAGLDCELTVIDDGADALNFVRRAAIQDGEPALDLAIVDLNLPKHGGVEIVEQMRSSESFSHLPVVIMSSSEAPRDRATLEQFHIARYIVKPPDLYAFLRIGSELKRILQENRNTDGSN